MTKRQEAKLVLKALGMPDRQQSDICAYSLLALLRLSSATPWSESVNEWMRIHDVLEFLRANYRGARYAENSRETFRKEAMHCFRTAALIEDNGVATNSPNYRYRVTSEALKLFRAYNGEEWNARLSDFLNAHESLKEVYASRKRMDRIPVSINGLEHLLSTGSHNRLQKAVVEEFAPRFLPEARCLYLGDTAKRDLFVDADGLRAIGLEMTVHDRMPDVVMHVPGKGWVAFVECVTSVGPMSPARVKEIEQMSSSVSSGKVFITAFLDRKTYKRFSDKIAWETDVWIADEPDHMIHLNGDRFMGPHRPSA